MSDLKSDQQYNNHRRWYPVHHFFLLPLGVGCFFAALYCTFHFPEQRLEWIAITIAFFMITAFGTIMRQHYALGNQNRLIRLEMRLRYFQLTGERFDLLEPQLSFGQIAALRFASDEELPALLQQTIATGLSPDKIKKSIKNWMPDNMRR